MKSVEELNAIKEKMQSITSLRLENRDPNTVRVIVGMGTCGIAAGARDVLNTFVDELAKRDMHFVMVSQVGCMGKCELEPMAEVRMPGGKDAVYVHMNPEKAIEVIEEHLRHGRVVEKYTIGSAEK